MGWLFIFSHQGRNTANFFVNERYRGKRVAGQLVGHALDTYPRIVVCQWEEVSRKFFRKLQRQYPGRVTVLDWWKNYGRYEQFVRELSPAA